MALAKQKQIFLQELMYGGSVTLPRAVKLYNKCGAKAHQHCGTVTAHEAALEDDTFDAVLADINRSIDRFGLEIKQAHSPWDRDTYVGLVNTADDPAARLATEFTTPQLSYFFAMVSDMLDDDGELPLVEMQNAGPAHKLRVADAGRVIQRLHRMGWVRVCKARRQGTKVTLGPRALLELPAVRAWALARAREAAAARAAGEEDPAQRESSQASRRESSQASRMESSQGSRRESWSGARRRAAAPPVKKARRGSARRASLAESSEEE